MPLDPDDRRAIEALIEEKVEPIRIQRVELEEIKVAVRGLQVETSHLVRAVEEQGRQIGALAGQVAELAQAQRRTERAIQEQGGQIAENSRQIAENSRQIAENSRQIAEDSKRIAGLQEESVRQGERMERGFAESREEIAEVRRELVRQGERIEKGFADFGRRMDEGLAESRRQAEEFRRQLGGLAEAYGLDLEDVARYVVPVYLREEEGWEVGALETDFVRAERVEYEIDLFGEARRGEESRAIVAEVRSRVHVREMEALLARNRDVEKALGRACLFVLFPRRIHPRALAMAREAGLRIISWDYQYRWTA